MHPPEEPCRSCGRTITWRRAWADDWEQVRYCSAACRRRKVRPVDEALERAILELLAARAGGATICPSEAARVVAADPRQQAGVRQEGADPADPDAWRVLMEPARRAARRLVARDEVEITQRGRVVDASRARGSIRIRRR